MAKSHTQYLKRMAKHHSLWSTYCEPCIYNEQGKILFKLESGTIVDLREYKQPLSIANKPSEFGIRLLDRIEGKRIYIESYDRRFNNLNYRILTMNG